MMKMVKRLNLPDAKLERESIQSLFQLSKPMRILAHWDSMQQASYKLKWFSQIEGWEMVSSTWVF